MNKQVKRTLISIVLSLVLVISSVDMPMSAFANEAEEPTVEDTASIQTDETSVEDNLKSDGDEEEEPGDEEISSVQKADEHTHSFLYTDLGDGTHFVSCNGCDYTQIEEHSYDTDGKCLCGAVKLPDLDETETMPVVQEKSAETESIDGTKEAAEEAVYPEISYTENIDGTSVTISAPADVFPEGTSFIITRVVVPDDTLDGIVSDSEEIVESFAYDITAICNGEEVQPKTENGLVSVSVSDIDIPKGASVSVAHISDDLSRVDEEIDADVVSGDVQFDAKHFSVYVITFVTNIDGTDAAEYDYSLYEGQEILLTDLLLACGLNISEDPFYAGATYTSNATDVHYYTTITEERVGSVICGLGPIAESYIKLDHSTTINGSQEILIRIDTSDYTYINAIRLHLSVKQDGRIMYGDNIFGDYDSDTKTLTISGSGDYYGAWTRPACYGEVEHVVLNCAPDENADFGMFQLCRNLRDISGTGWDSATSIPNGMFNGCYSLSAITIPSSVTSIGDRAFFDCRSLSEVLIPSSVTSIGEDVFSFSSADIILDGVTLDSTALLRTDDWNYDISNIPLSLYYNAETDAFMDALTGGVTYHCRLLKHATVYYNADGTDRLNFVSYPLGTFFALENGYWSWTMNNAGYDHVGGDRFSCDQGGFYVFYKSTIETYNVRFHYCYPDGSSAVSTVEGISGATLTAPIVPMYTDDAGRHRFVGWLDDGYEDTTIPGTVTEDADYFAKYQLIPDSVLELWNIGLNSSAPNDVWFKVYEDNYTSGVIATLTYTNGTDDGDGYALNLMGSGPTCRFQSEWPWNNIDAHYAEQITYITVESGIELNQAVFGWLPAISDVVLYQVTLGVDGSACDYGIFFNSSVRHVQLIQCDIVKNYMFANCSVSTITLEDTDGHGCMINEGYSWGGYKFYEVVDDANVNYVSSFPDGEVTETFTKNLVRYFHEVEGSWTQYHVEVIANAGEAATYTAPDGMMWASYAGSNVEMDLSSISGCQQAYAVPIPVASSVRFYDTNDGVNWYTNDEMYQEGMSGDWFDFSFPDSKINHSDYSKTMTYIGFKENNEGEILYLAQLQPGDHVYYGQYEMSDTRYAVTLNTDPGEADGEMSPLFITYGDNSVLPDPAFTPTDVSKHFVGWQPGSMSDGYWDDDLDDWVEYDPPRLITSGSRYSAGTKADLLVNAVNGKVSYNDVYDLSTDEWYWMPCITLYAIWSDEAPGTTVSYWAKQSNGAEYLALSKEYAIDEVIIDEMESETVTAPDGKVFNGCWYTDSACTEKYTFGYPAMANSTINLYAGYVTACTVRFFGYSGRTADCLINSINIPAGNPVRIPDIVPTRTVTDEELPTVMRWEIAGWTDVEDSDVVKYTTVSTFPLVSDNTDYYAVYTGVPVHSFKVRIPTTVALEEDTDHLLKASFDVFVGLKTDVDETFVSVSLNDGPNGQIALEDTAGNEIFVDVSDGTIGTWYRTDMSNGGDPYTYYTSSEISLISTEIVQEYAIGEYSGALSFVISTGN